MKVDYYRVILSGAAAMPFRPASFAGRGPHRARFSRDGVRVGVPIARGFRAMG